jgi:hypothetical protein
VPASEPNTDSGISPAFFRQIAIEPPLGVTMDVSAEERREAELRASCAVMALSITIAAPAAAQPGDRAIGLLALRQLEGPLCEPPPPGEIALYATPESADPIGGIRADRHPASDSDCYRVILTVYWRADGRVHQLPTEEYEEEEPVAAIVVEQRRRWFKVQVPDGAAWVHTSDRDQYFSLQRLVVERPAYLTEAWDGTLAKAPGDRGRAAADPRRRYIPVRFVESRDVRGALWLKIGLMSHTVYESDEPPRVVATGWVPAHDPSGKAVVWFYSRD